MNKLILILLCLMSLGTAENKPKAVVFFPTVILPKPTDVEIQQAQSSIEAAKQYLRKRMTLYVSTYESEYLATKKLSKADSPFDILYQRIDTLKLFNIVNAKSFREDSYIQYIRAHLETLTISSEKYLGRIQNLEAQNISSQSQLAAVKLRINSLDAVSKQYQNSKNNIQIFMDTNRNLELLASSVGVLVIIFGFSFYFRNR